ncbi:MAG: acyltransferase family protein [Streptosporangiales bacterium]|nr:acyltransferase family protein [Streptosporangiales bacterium]MBO0891439.1 acyltransferase family protein [Acidothermales bacterium]
MTDDTRDTVSLPAAPSSPDADASTAPTTPAEPPASTGEKPEQLDTLLPKARDPWFDNAKFLAIALVVVGHGLEPLRGLEPVRALYYTIYLFHMPVFILVAGYLSRSFTAKPRQVQRLIAGVAVPYLVFEVSYELASHFWGGASWTIDTLTPSFAMWFLLALFIWRVTTPLWNAIRPGYAIAIAVAVSLAAGFSTLTPVLDLHRVLGFLPFYVAGLVLPAGYFDALRRWWARALALPLLAGAFVTAYLFRPSLQWLYYRERYHDLGGSNLSGVWHRAAFLVAGFVLLSAFLALVPRRHVWFTSLGAATMYVYLLHRYPRKALAWSGLYDAHWLHSLAGAAVVVVGALAVTLVLSSPPVVRIFRPVVEPKLTWLFRRGEGHHATS